MNQIFQLKHKDHQIRFLKSTYVVYKRQSKVKVTGRLTIEEWKNIYVLHVLAKQKLVNIKYITCRLLLEIKIDVIYQYKNVLKI